MLLTPSLVSWIVIAEYVSSVFKTWRVCFNQSTLLTTSETAKPPSPEAAKPSSPKAVPGSPAVSAWDFRCSSNPTDWANDFPQCSHRKWYLPACVCRCLFSVQEREKDFKQCSHLNGFLPAWTSRCLLSWSERKYALGHWLHLYLLGLSLKKLFMLGRWVRRWSVRPLNSLNDSSQWPQWKSLTQTRFRKWADKDVALLNILQQSWQRKGLSSLWRWVLMCAWKWSRREKPFLHCLHLKILSTLCVAKCLESELANLNVFSQNLHWKRWATAFSSIATLYPPYRKINQVRIYNVIRAFL